MARAARGAPSLVLLQAFRAASSVVFFAFAARLLPRIEEYGLLSALTLLYNLYAVLTGLGLPAAETYYMARALSQGTGQEASVLRLGLGVGLLAGLTASLSNALLSRPLAALVIGEAGAAGLISLLSLSLLPNTLCGHLYAALRAQQRFREAASIEAAGVTIRNLGGLALLSLYGLPGALYGWALGDTTRLALYLLRLRGLMERGGTGLGLGPLLKYGLSPYANDLVGYLYGSLDRLLLLTLLGSRQLGLYTPGVTAALMVSSLIGAAGDALFPEFSRRAGRGDVEGMMRASRLSSRYLAAFAVPCLVGLAAVSLPTVQLFAGLRYSASSPVLLIVALAASGTAFSLVAGSLCLSLGVPRLIFYSTLAGAASQGALSLLLIPPLGLLGAALSKGSSLLIAFSSNLALLSRRWNVRRSFDWPMLAKAYIASFAAGLAALLVQGAVYHRYLLPLYVLSGLFAYAATLRALRAWSKEDAGILRELLGPRAWRAAEPLMALAGLKAARADQGS